MPLIFLIHIIIGIASAPTVYWLDPELSPACALLMPFIWPYCWWVYFKKSNGRDG